jgi:hypothetical protein
MKGMGPLGKRGIRTALRVSAQSTNTASRCYEETDQKVSLGVPIHAPGRPQAH